MSEFERRDKGEPGGSPAIDDSPIVDCGYPAHGTWAMMLRGFARLASLGSARQGRAGAA
jgi:hypothetical protein